jgi:hypothetical protein
MGRSNGDVAEGPPMTQATFWSANRRAKLFSFCDIGIAAAIVESEFRSSTVAISKTIIEI